MKKYVAKEDVQKGLVNSIKPPQSKQQFQQKRQQKVKQYKPKYQNQQNYDKPHPDRHRRQNKHYIALRNITLETPQPEVPKKLFPKPNREKFNEDLQKLKAQKLNLNQQRKHMIQDQRHMIKDTVQNKKTGQVHRSKYSAILKQTNNKKILIEKQIKSIEQFKTNIQGRINELKNNIDLVRNPKDVDDCSTQQLNYRKHRLQVKLSTADIDKKAEAKIQHEIMLISRALLKSKSEIQLQTEIAKYKDHLDIEYKQLNNIYQQLNLKYKQIKSVRKQIANILEEKKKQESQIMVVKNIDEIKQEFDGKITKIDSQKAQINQKIEILKTKFYQLLDQYEDQQDLLDKINRIKEKKEQIRQKEKQQQQKQKKRQQEEEKRKKQQQQWQKKIQQRKKHEQERKKIQQQRKKKLQQQRQQYINRNPNYQHIEMCTFLISYCQMLKPQNKIENIEEKPQRVLEEGEIKGKQWENQLKKGAHIIAGKKSNLEQQAPLKGKKTKKNKQKKQKILQQSGFFHSHDIQDRFQTLKVLPPMQLEDVNKTINQLNDKIQAFKKPTQQQIQIFKQQAIKQFDRMNGLNQKKVGYKEKEGKSVVQNQKEIEDKEKKDNKQKYKNNQVSLIQQDFPGLNI